jgi:hypothetical protein
MEAEATVGSDQDQVTVETISGHPPYVMLSTRSGRSYLSLRDAYELGGFLLALGDKGGK